MRFHLQKTARIVSCIAACVLATLSLASCSREGGGTSGNTKQQVVLYSSIDDPILRPIVAAFTKDTGIEVLIVGDTEATKTTGLVERLLSEKDHPRADVWWSSEPLGTIRLAREGVLEKVELDWKARERPGDESKIRSQDGLMYAVAFRQRVIARRVGIMWPSPANTGVSTLAASALKGRIGMARPQFGTTRGQIAAMTHASPIGMVTWLRALKQNELRLYDGNSAVVRALAQGEIDAGFTDTDDVIEGQREKWPIEIVNEPVAGRAANDPIDALQSAIRLDAAFKKPIPTTVARIARGAHLESAKRLIDWLVSRHVEDLLHDQNRGFRVLSDANNFGAAATNESFVDAFAPDEEIGSTALSGWDVIFGK